MAEETKTKTHAPRVAEYKKETVKDIVNLINQYPIIGAVNMENLPTPQLQKMRALLRDKVVMTMTKRRLIKIAIEQCKATKKGIEKIGPYLKGMPALIFTKENPFALFKMLKKSKSPAPAKAGQTAPKDILVTAGPTDFAPGPIIGELAQIGIKSGVEGGKVAIKQDSVIAKEGEKITAKAATILTRLGLTPMEVGLDLVAVYEKGTIYSKDILDIDEDRFMAQLQEAASGAINLSIFVGYPTKDNINLMISKAFNDAKALALEQNIIDEGIIEELLGKAERTMLSLKDAANIQVQEKAVGEEVKEEKPKKERKPKEIKKEEVKVEKPEVEEKEEKIEKKEEKILEKEEEIIKEEKELEKPEPKKVEAPVEKEVEKEVKEIEEEKLEKERIEKEKELEKIEKEKEAKRKAEEERKKQEEAKKRAEEEVKRKAEEQKKIEEEKRKAEAAKRLEEEKRKSEAARQKAEEEARRKTEEEEARKAGEERKRKEIEEKKRLEEEKRKAEERRKAEEAKRIEEEKRKIEEQKRQEERRKAEEEAKKKAELDETEKKVAEMVKRTRLRAAGKEPTAERLVEEIEEEAKEEISKKEEKIIKKEEIPKPKEKTAEELLSILKEKGTLRKLPTEKIEPLKKEERPKEKKRGEKEEIEDLTQQLIKKGSLRKK